jgi:CheY-like chemotaxis protein
VICVVETRRGAIKASSPDEEQEATFTITLSARLRNRTTTKMHRVEIKKAMDASGKPNLGGLRILVVDDEADMRDMLEIRLRQYGADVITVASAEAAMEALAQEEPRPDLIVSDIGMPGEDGYSLMRRVRALDPEQGGLIPAIAVTAYSRIEDRAQAMAAGFQMHISKPVKLSELGYAITSIIGRFNHHQ